MATIKSYSDLEQSKKLAEILPLESADMRYICIDICKGLKYMPEPRFIKNIPDHADEYDINAWSLAALLSVLDYPQLSKDKLGSGKVGWMVSIYPNDCRYDSCWHDNPVDACVELILKLNELNLL